MTHRLGIRLAAFVLSTLVTITLFAGLPTLAVQHANGLQLSQSSDAPRA